MSRLRNTLATSDHPVIRLARSLRRKWQRFAVPAPKVIVKPALAIFVAVRSVYYFLFRVFVCEPLFKAYCTSYGRGLRTDVYIHWVQGRGQLIVGDDVLVDGKCSFTFAARYTDRPTLTIGDRTVIGHQCHFTVGNRVSIGRDCLIAAGMHLFDSSGHPTDPVSRLQGLPPAPNEVRPITIEDNVWVGSGSIIFPGVTVGEGSVVSAGAVVVSDVPPYTIVAGNPARKIGVLKVPPGAIERSSRDMSHSTNSVHAEARVPG
ncbi:MAG: acyltransferase [Planctomycetaceae bacterium]